MKRIKDLNYKRLFNSKAVEMFHITIALDQLPSLGAWMKFKDKFD
jgi:hypothetical protein